MQKSNFLKFFFISFFTIFISCDLKQKKTFLPLFTLGGINLISNSSLKVTEGGSSVSYTISLKNSPTSSVTFKPTSDGQLSTDKTEYIFDASNWATPQTITVSAIDDGKIEGDHKSILKHSVISDDSFYSGTVIPEMNFEITDNDSKSVLNNAIQSGTFTSNSTQQTVNITGVNTSKSFVYCNFGLGGSAANNASTCQLNSTGDGILIQSGGGAATVNWYVAEFSEGLSTQRGSVSMGSSTSTLDISISEIDLKKSFILVYSRINNGGSNIDERRVVMANFTDNKTLTIQRSETGGSIDIEWQVIQMSSALVQSGTTTLSDFTKTISVSKVDTSKSFLISSILPDSSVDGIDNQFYVLNEILSDSTISFTRKSNTNSVNISWFLIELFDDTKVQNNSVTISSTDTTNINMSLTSSVSSTSKSLVVHSANIIDDGNSTSTADQDSGTFYYTFTNNSTIQFTRNSGETPRTGKINAFILEF